MKKTILLSFVALAAAVASGNSFKLNLTQDTVIEGKNLKAGEYKVSVVNGNAILKQGKDLVEVPVREETQPKKFYSNELKYKDASTLQEVNVGGTTTKLVFEGATSMHSGL